jgi:hypothetical protein
MVVMMATINKTHFGGRQAVTCFSCHRGTDRPKVTPSVAALYDSPPPEDPRDIIEQATCPGGGSAHRYVEAVEERREAASQLHGLGSSIGYGPGEKRAVEIFADAEPAHHDARPRSDRTTTRRTPGMDRRAPVQSGAGWRARPGRAAPGRGTGLPASSRSPFNGESAWRR